MMNNNYFTLLSQIRLSLLDSGQDHVTDTGSRQSIKTTLDALDGNDVQVLGTRVIGAVHDGSDRQSKRHSVLVTSSSTTTWI